jgi:hypothetical protein
MENTGNNNQPDFSSLGRRLRNIFRALTVRVDEMLAKVEEKVTGTRTENETAPNNLDQPSGTYETDAQYMKL